MKLTPDCIMPHCPDGFEFSVGYMTYFLRLEKKSHIIKIDWNILKSGKMHMTNAIFSVN